tara:strand:+ start:5 stop:226 length:222 start_codon:yes stop_codon:yes gene_type:complete
MVKRSKKKRRIKIMETEHKEELLNLKLKINNYKDALKKPAWKYTFGKEDSHDIAKRIIKQSEERIKEIKSYYE